MITSRQSLENLLRRVWQEIGSEVIDHCSTNRYAVEVTIDRAFDRMNSEEKALAANLGAAKLARTLKLI